MEIFNKESLTVEEQLDLLIRRNLIVDNYDLAVSILKRIGYYHLSSYMRLFQKGDNHEFNDKVSFNKRIINKQSGFLLERSHIFFFEVLPEKFFAVINFIDEKIIQNISYFIVAIINCLGFVFEAETKKIAPSKIIRNIFIIFCIVAILTILIALFGRFR